MKRSIRTISTSISLVSIVLVGGGGAGGGDAVGSLSTSAFSFQQQSLRASSYSTKHSTRAVASSLRSIQCKPSAVAEQSYPMSIRRDGRLYAISSITTTTAAAAAPTPPVSSASSSSSSSAVSATNNRSIASSTPSSVLSRLWKSLDLLPKMRIVDGNIKSTMPSRPRPSPGVGFFMALNERDVDKALSFIVARNEKDDNDDGFDVEFEDTDFPNMWRGKAELERNLRLLSQLPSNPIIVVDDVVYDPSVRREGILFHLENPLNGAFLKKGAAFFELMEGTSQSSSDPSLLIQKAFVVRESDKSGEASLKILKTASDIISFTSNSRSPPSNKVEATTSTSTAPTRMAQSLPDSSPSWWSVAPSNQSAPSSKPSSSTLPEQYFDSWNKRDMERASSLFSDDVEYDDTAFPTPFKGKAALERHLNVCANSMPPTFAFVLDDQVNAGDKIMVRWHVENGSDELPFTRGCSFYESDKGKIIKGTDLKEPAVFKTGGVYLFVQSTLFKLQDEPIRFVPLITWVTYLYVVFFSDWFFGMPVQAFEPRTWDEVRDLALNFFFVSPILGLPFSPVIHPGLEGIFNLVLSWAALFAGFLSDDRPKKANLLPMVPIVVGMQFLTSAFLLPYLVTRSNEADSNISRQQLTPISRLMESKLLGITMGTVGTGSVLWGLFARTDDFGGIPERFSSLVDLLAIDRVGSSFLVDLALFGLFQGWLVDDDLQRRGMDSTSPIATIAKFVPFFGLALYLIFRSPILAGEEESSYSKQ